MKTVNSEFVHKIYRFFCNHLVGLAIWYETILEDGSPSGDMKFYCYSGTIISFKGIWNFLTAGHILEEIETNLKGKKIILRETKFIDVFGNNSISKDPIPFDYHNSPKVYQFNKSNGIDFGLILLNPIIKGLLEANGIIAICEEDWKNQSTELFEKYWMVGFPKERIKSEKVYKNKYQYIVRGRPQPAILSINKLQKWDLEGGNAKYSQFIGKLCDERLLINDITGMSGGPIIGLSKDLSKEWIVAIQSNWREDERIIFGCEVAVFASLVENWLEKSRPDDMKNQ